MDGKRTQDNGAIPREPRSTVMTSPLQLISKKKIGLIFNAESVFF